MIMWIFIDMDWVGQWCGSTAKRRRRLGVQAGGKRVARSPCVGANALPSAAPRRGARAWDSGAAGDCRVDACVDRSAWHWWSMGCGTRATHASPLQAAGGTLVGTPRKTAFSGLSIVKSASQFLAGGTLVDTSYILHLTFYILHFTSYIEKGGTLVEFLIFNFSFNLLQR